MGVKINHSFPPLAESGSLAELPGRRSLADPSRLGQAGIGGQAASAGKA